MLSEKDYIHGKLIKFTATDKLRLHGFLVERKKSDKCMIYVHGMNGNFYSSGIGKAISIEASRRGYAAFMINTRGHDIESSSHTIDGTKSKRVHLGTKLEKFEDSVHDIRGAISIMKKMGYKKFVLSGHSTGCQKILYYLYKTKDSSVKALVLLAPDDDYNLNKKSLGRRWSNAVKEAKKHSNDSNLTINPYGIAYSARRFLSIADLNEVESRIFNYDGELKEFSKVKVPIFVVFGTKDEGALKPVAKYISILEEATNSTKFASLLIEGANHSLKGQEPKVAKAIINWLSLTVK